MNKTEIQKDYHDEAVYAFTIVTVIFLPLSSVASIFGMNTSDFRDMEQGQWLYWATAVPVTTLVILVGLWWMGETGRLRDVAGKILNLRRQPAGAYATPITREEIPERCDYEIEDVRRVSALLRPDRVGARYRL